MNANDNWTAPPVEQLSPAESAPSTWPRTNVERRHHSLSWRAGNKVFRVWSKLAAAKATRKRRKSLCGGAARSVERQTFTPAAGVCFGAVALIVWRAMEIIAFSRCSSGMFFTMF